MNLDRRQLSFEQIKELQKNLKKDRELMKKTALQMRKQGMTQEQVAGKLGVAQQTIDVWESGKEEFSITKIGNAKPPDCRIVIPKEEEVKIYERSRGEPQKQIASDYKVTQPQTSNIILL